MIVVGTIDPHPNSVPRKDATLPRPAPAASAGDGDQAPHRREPAQRREPAHRKEPKLEAPRTIFPAEGAPQSAEVAIVAILDIPSAWHKEAHVMCGAQQRWNT